MLPKYFVAILAMIVLPPAYSASIADLPNANTDAIVSSSSSELRNSVPEVVNKSATVVESRMFGAQLFGGMFRATLGPGFNPNYLISIGDRIQLRLWGAFAYEGQLVVDPQGNIFIPNVGAVKIVGTNNASLNAVVQQQVRKIYVSNVQVYATLDAAQPVKVYVTGFVKQPGLYGGVAADSLLSYLDKAGGVDPERGSYVDVAVKRGDTVLRRVNLYDFLLNGNLDLMQFNDGDVVLVGPRKHTFRVEGEVFNAYDFEFDQPELTLSRAMQIARPKPGATHVSIIRRQGTEKRSEYYSLANAANVKLQDGDSLVVTADRYAGTIQIRVEGAHSGEHALVLPYGASMQDVLRRINTNAMSQITALQLFRKSVAIRQKEMLDVALNKLEEGVLSARSATSEEANLRVKEADLVLQFVKRARGIQPKGQVVLNEKNLASTLLEDGDIIRIPEKSSLVMVHGEVLFPNAIAWETGETANGYIEKTGGFTQTSDTSKVILIRQGGEISQVGRDTTVAPGDEIMVLPKVESKSIEVTRGITAILYQIAVAAKIILNI